MDDPQSVDRNDLNMGISRRTAVVRTELNDHNMSRTQLIDRNRSTESRGVEWESQNGYTIIGGQY